MLEFFKRKFKIQVNKDDVVVVFTKEKMWVIDKDDENDDDYEILITDPKFIAYAIIERMKNDPDFYNLILETGKTNFINIYNKEFNKPILRDGEFIEHKIVEDGVLLVFYRNEKEELIAYCDPKNYDKQNAYLAAGILHFTETQPEILSKAVDWFYNKIDLMFDLEKGKVDRDES